MVKRILAQLESLAKFLQVIKIKRNYPDQTGIKIGQGFLWQHPGHARENILQRWREKIIKS